MTQTKACRGKAHRLCLTLALLLGSLAARRAPRAQAAGPLVLAFYYTWYDMNTWSSGNLPDLPAQQYVSMDPATIDRHVGEAQRAGIDAFVQSWYGPGGGNQTEGNFQTLLNTASVRGFRAAVDFEVGSPYFGSPADRIAALQHLLSVHANHPAYLRVDGKPIVFFWASWLLSVDEWAGIRAQVDPSHRSIWIVEGASADYLAVFDGLHLYNIAWSDNPAGTLARWGQEVRTKAAALGSYKYWAATVMPGWDDTRVPGRTGTFVRERVAGAYYQQCWSGAVASSPDMIILTSFNEWMEGSMIEPSVTYGNAYLDLTAQMTAAYKAGGVPAPPAVAPTDVPSPTSPLLPTDTPAPTPTIGETATPEPTPSLAPSLASTPTPAAAAAAVPTASAAATVTDVLGGGEENSESADAGADVGDAVVFTAPRVTLRPSATPSPVSVSPTPVAWDASSPLPCLGSSLLAVAALGLSRRSRPD
jgi:hypothetical protein